MEEVVCFVWGGPPWMGVRVHCRVRVETGWERGTWELGLGTDRYASFLTSRSGGRGLFWDGDVDGAALRTSVGERAADWAPVGDGLRKSVSGDPTYELRACWC